MAADVHQPAGVLKKGLPKDNFQKSVSFDLTFYSDDPENTPEETKAKPQKPARKTGFGIPNAEPDWPNAEVQTQHAKAGHRQAPFDVEEIPIEVDEETEQFAKELGLDLEKEPDLAWLVLEAMSASLPPGWCACSEDDGSVTYKHTWRGEEKKEHPARETYRELVAFIVQLRGTAGLTLAATKEAIAKHVAQVQHLYAQEEWKGPFLYPEGKFYYNGKRGVTTANDQRAALEQEVSLRSHVLYKALLDQAPPPKKISFRGLSQGVWWAVGLIVSPMMRTYTIDLLIDPEIIKQIDNDVARTAGGNEELTKSLGWTRALLLRHAAEDPELGYCQGMNFVAAVVSVSATSQDTAWIHFKALLKRLRGLWLPGFPLMHTAIGVFSELASAEPWFKHFEANGVKPDLYMPQALLSFFSKWLSLPTRLLFLADFEREGLPALLACALATLGLHGGRLRDMGDADDVLMHLGSLGTHPIDEPILVGCMQGWLPKAVRACGATRDAEKSGEQRSCPMRWDNKGPKKTGGAARSIKRYGLVARFANLMTRKKRGKE